MRQKLRGQALLEELRGQQTSNNGNSHNLQQQISDQISNNQLDTQPASLNIATPPPSDDENFGSSSSPNETQSQEEVALVVKVRDTTTGEIATRKMVATQVWHLEQTKKVIVGLNGDGQGNDNGSNLLVRFLGQLARNSKVCPISVERWDMMPKDNRRQQWKYIENNFEFDYAAGILWATRILGERWKAQKYRLRCKYFYPNKSKDDILANPPPDVNIVDWTAFVHHYKNDKMKKVCSQNTNNRKKLKVSHAGGSKSNARRACQMERQLGRPVCRSEVILSTLVKKNGSYVNDGETLADAISEHLPRDQELAATAGVPSKILALPDDAIGKVCGVEHSGRVRGMGTGICPSVAFGKPGYSVSHGSFGSSSSNASQKRVEDLVKHVETLQEKLSGYEETKEQLAHTQEQLVQTQEQLAQTQNQFAQTQTQFAALHKFLQAKFGSELPD